MTQCERVLALLRERGESGVNTAEFQELPIVDGGAPILRLAARIDNLKHRGFAITSRRQPNGTSTYTLVSELGVERDRTDAPVGQPTVPQATAGVPVAPSSPVSLNAEPLDSLFDTTALQQGASYRDADLAA